MASVHVMSCLAVLRAPRPKEADLVRDTCEHHVLKCGVGVQTYRVLMSVSAHHIQMYGDLIQVGTFCSRPGRTDEETTSNWLKSKFESQERVGKSWIVI